MDVVVELTVMLVPLTVRLPSTDRLPPIAVFPDVCRPTSAKNLDCVPIYLFITKMILIKKRGLESPLKRLLSFNC
jgi:hypothetical protein